MDNTKNILPEIWDKIKDKKILDYLNRDELGTIILDVDVFWFEMNNSQFSLPNYVYNYLKKFLIKKYHYKYLYDIKT